MTAANSELDDFLAGVDMDAVRAAVARSPRLTDEQIAVVVRLLGDAP